jgi:hypothetical protein
MAKKRAKTPKTSRSKKKARPKDLKAKAAGRVRGGATLTTASEAPSAVRWKLDTWRPSSG